MPNMYGFEMKALKKLWPVEMFDKFYFVVYMYVAESQAGIEAWIMCIKFLEHIYDPYICTV